MNEWVLENMGTVVAIYGLIFTAVVIRNSISDRSHKEALAAKDATIELLKLRADELANIKAEYDGYRSSSEKHVVVTDETIVILHKRISDLESKLSGKMDEPVCPNCHTYLSDKGASLSCSNCGYTKRRPLNIREIE